MKKEMTEEQKYKCAKNRVLELKSYYTHLFVFVIVNTFLVGLNFATEPKNLWVGWVLFGWGIGLIAHTLTTFGINGFLGSKWEEKKIEELMNK